MEDKIEVGEYVRTKRGEVCKVLGISPELRDGKRLYSHKSYYLDIKKGSLTEPFIAKHSKNIIYLIEEGDYVNGEKILRITDLEMKEKKLFVTFKFGKTEHCVLWSNEDIKSIVTKEQFNSIKYEID